MIKTLKVMFNKTGVARTTGNTIYSPRITLPRYWLEQIGVSVEEPHINLEIKGDKLIITKTKK